MTLNIHLTTELEQLVRESVASGQYGSASEVIREAVRVWKAEREWREDLRRKIADGYAQAKAGELVDGPAAIRELRAALERGR